MKLPLHIACLLLLCGSFLPGCKSAKPTQAKAKPRPDWVLSRPVNSEYYIGIGTASKTKDRLDYQQVAKKHALDDLVSEIKVTVSSNSVLKQVQYNQDFNQQLDATTRVTALNTIEHFDIVDSWEDANEFWIYYRLSKAEYEAARERKIQVQVNRAEELLLRAEEMDARIQYTQVLYMRIQALVFLQNYLNEDIYSSYHSTRVKLVNEICNTIQDQLSAVQFKTSVTSLKGTVGKALPLFQVNALLNGKPLPYLPLKAGSDGTIVLFAHAETDEQGAATFSDAHVQGVGNVQFLRISTDVEKIISRNDSINPMVRGILLQSMQVPEMSVKVLADALKVYIESNEQNLSKPLAETIVEPLVKKDLQQNGCVLVSTPNEADYVVRIRATTEAQGAIWGNMQGAAMQATFFMTDPRKQVELARFSMPPVKGFQTTPENAGLDAYKKSVAELNKTFLPALHKALFSGGR